MYTILLIASACGGPRDIPVFVRYQRPDKPEHVLKEHVLTFSISGRDTTPPHAESAAVRHWNRLERGSPMGLASRRRSPPSRLLRRSSGFR